MNADNYAGWSIKELKSAAADLDIAALDHHADTFAQGERALLAVRDSFTAALGYLAGGWSGTAAQAAAGNARSSIDKVTTMQEQATQSNSQTVAYAAETRRQQEAVAAIPDVDTGWGHAFASGGLGGLLGVGVAKYQQHEEYEKQRAKAARLVSQIDSRGDEHADEMDGQTWLKPAANSEKPKALTPPAGRAGTTDTSGNTGGHYGPSARPGHGSPEPVRASSPESGSTGHHSGHLVSSAPELTGGSGPAATVPQAKPDMPIAQPPSNGQSPLAAGEGLGTARNIGLAGGGAAVAAGLGLTTGGLRSPGLVQVGVGSGTGSGYRGSGLPEPGGQAGGAGRGSAGGRVGAGPDEAGRTPVAARTAGLELAGEGGVKGGYPPSGLGGRRRDDDDDELRARPEWLIEPDDIWGDGRRAAPPVLGE